MEKFLQSRFGRSVRLGVLIYIIRFSGLFVGQNMLFYNFGLFIQQVIMSIVLGGMIVIAKDAVVFMYVKSIKKS